MSAGRVIAPFTNGATGTARVPGSKSITNRAVLCAALADGRSTLEGVLFADDTEAMIDAARAIGATVQADRAERRLVIDGIGTHAGPDSPARRTSIHSAASGAHTPGSDPVAGASIHGAAGAGGDSGGVADAPRHVHARSSGTTARFVLPVLASLGGNWVLDGDPQLRRRPIHDLIGALRSLGAEVRNLGEEGCLPVELSSAPVGEQGADSRHVRIRADVSSQFASGLLLAGPLRGGIRLEVDAAFGAVSRPYIDMTVAVMEAFGARIEAGRGGRYVVGEGAYRAADYRIEPDASAATYFWAAGALCGGSVRVEGLGKSSIQGDVRCASILGEMGAEVTVGDDAVVVGAPPGGRLRGGSFDLRDCSDVTQTLAAVAAFAEGATHLSGIGFIRRKETDRIADTVAELAKRGVDAVAEPDGITVRANPFGLRSGRVDCHGDHRMAMSMTLIGSRVAGIEIDDPGCVAKTFPEFFEAFEALRPAAGTQHAPATPVIAIDGPAASGKSSVARAVAARLGMDYLDTGAMYRAVAWAALQAGIDPGDADAVAEIARTAGIDISTACDAPTGRAVTASLPASAAAPDPTHGRDAGQRTGSQQVTVNGADATDAIRTPEVDRSVSAVAANPGVRRVLVERQRDWAVRLGGGVMEGRDIGSVVFPDAVLKVFLTATPLVRAARRLAQHRNAAAASPGPDDAVHALAAELDRRDRLDAGRADSPLQVAAGAVIIDTSEMSQHEVVEMIVTLHASAAGTVATPVPAAATR